MGVCAGRILVIDDDVAVVEVLAVCLREQGYEVSSALTSGDGLRLITMSHPDVVLLDIGLPDMNGVEVLRRIRSIDPTIRVIMVTANTDVLIAEESLRLGAFYYVDKPFDLAFLTRVVAMAFQRRPSDQTITRADLNQ